MEFPITRMRRLRRNEPLRAMVRETRLDPGALILPLFMCPGEGVRKAIDSMPGVFNLSMDEAVKEAEAAAALGIGGLLLFGLPEAKDEQATGAWATTALCSAGCGRFKQSGAAKKLVLMADVCLCEYTSHGHCGVVSGRDNELRDRERFDAGAAGQDRRFAGARGSGHRRAQRHDGWPRGGDSRRAG